MRLSKSATLTWSRVTLIESFNGVSSFSSRLPPEKKVDQIGGHQGDLSKNFKYLQYFMTAIFDGAVQVTDSIANLFGCVAKYGQYYLDVSSVTAVL